MNDWFKVVMNKAKSIGEIFIYGFIADEKWYEEDVTPNWIKNELKKIDSAKQVNLYVNSPGGGVFAGMAIHSMLSRLKMTVTAYVDGIAASIASVVVMAADKILIPPSGMMMIHNPSGIAAGDSTEMRKTADMLDKVKKSIISVYKNKTGLKEKDISSLMDEEYWMTGEEAVTMDFADELTSDKQVKACIKNNVCNINGIKFTYDKFKTFPEDKFSEDIRSGSNYRDAKLRYLKLLNGGV